jgi:putative ATPase
MDLFKQANSDKTARQPLAARMRPKGLDEIEGQDHILGEGRLLRRAIEADCLNSLVFYGPPGCGKTSLAEVIASVTRRHFERTSGAIANVAGLREIVDRARRRLECAGPDEDGARGTILFVDEIHRFSKSQQDVLLPHVESGTVTLIGATTHNPMIFINRALTSRSLVFELKPLSEEDLVALARRALADAECGLGAIPVAVPDEELYHLCRLCEGDARRTLNALEIAVLSTPAGETGCITLTRDIISDSIQRKLINYDRDEDGHYDTISAFIKSVRGSDPHAAVYWLAKMLYAGEDPRFIARRLVILASEDIGNADPRGLYVAVSAMQAAEFVGMPEARIILSQATTYLATAPKSNAAYLAINQAMADVQAGRVLEVPDHLKNLKVPKAGEQRVGVEYRYPHDFEGHVVEQEYVPTSSRYYIPSAEGYEDIIGQRMQRWISKRKKQN